MIENQRDKPLIPLVSIIILNYNAGQLLIDCVESIFKTKYPNYEIIIVDNASKDESHKKCKEKFRIVKLIENKKNLGYCEGNNVGIRSAKGDFIVILNPDTIVDPSWLDELIIAYRIHGDGLYQPKFLTTIDHNILMSTGNMIQLFGFGFSRGKGERDVSKFEEIEVVGYASGTCLFTTSEIFKKVGLFDSFLFAYHDDLELCWRAALQGIKSYYVPKSIVFHPLEGFSFKWSPLKFYLLERNRHYCLLTHYSRTTFYKMLPSLILVEIIVLIFYLKRGIIKEKFKACIDVIKNTSRIQKRYLEIQKERVIVDKEIIKTFQDSISIPESVYDTKNQMFINFIKKLSKITRSFI